MASSKVGSPARHPLHAGVGHKRQGAVGDGFDGEDTFLSPLWGLSVQAAVSVCKKTQLFFSGQGVLPVAFTKFPCSSALF